MDLVNRLREFIEQEARSCSMDFGCVTYLCVYRISNECFSCCNWE